MGSALINLRTGGAIAAEAAAPPSGSKTIKTEARGSRSSSIPVQSPLCRESAMELTSPVHGSHSAGLPSASNSALRCCIASDSLRRKKAFNLPILFWIKGDGLCCETCTFGFTVLSSVETTLLAIRANVDLMESREASAHCGLDALGAERIHSVGRRRAAELLQQRRSEDRRVSETEDCSATSALIALRAGRTRAWYRAPPLVTSTRSRTKLCSSESALM